MMKECLLKQEVTDSIESIPLKEPGVRVFVIKV